MGSKFQMSQLYWSKLPTQHFHFKQFIPNSAYDYTRISVIKWHQQMKSTFKFLVNSTEGTLVAKSISCNVRKVSIVCDQRAPWWQLNNEYTTQTVFYLLISFRHLFIILICIFNHCNLLSCLRMLFYAKWLLTSYQYSIC